ncbi:MAG: RNA polymerase sigma factor [Alphaproteobacteria bacterium]|nr:RNA polymerase sigma factor [Alphaproteobacteria bacterium]
MEQEVRRVGKWSGDGFRRNLRLNANVRGLVLKRDERREFTTALIAQLPGLRRYAAALSGSLVMGDDLVQDCLERALRQSDHLRDPQRLGAWLRSILHNLYIDELRRKRSRGIEEDITGMADDLVIGTLPRDGVPLHEFTAAMGSLTAEHRQILLLVGVEGLNYRQIAEELQIPIGTVMSRLARARERLRNALENGLEREPADNVASLDARRKMKQ